MYEKLEEMVPKTAIFDHDTIKIRLCKPNFVKSITKIILHSEYSAGSHSFVF